MRGGGGEAGSTSSFSNWQHLLSLPVVTVNGDHPMAPTDFFATRRCKAGEGANTRYEANGASHYKLLETNKG